MAIIFCLRVEDAHQLMKQLPAGKLRDLIKLKIHDANWNPSPARPRTLIIRDEGDSLPLLAINEDVIQPVDELENPMALTIRREGMITRKDPHSCMVLCDDGDRSFAYRLNFDSLGPAWEDVKVGNRVSFIRVDSDRTKDDSRAIEVRIIDRTTLDGM